MVYIYLHIYHENQPNVGKHTIHGWVTIQLETPEALCFHRDPRLCWHCGTSMAWRGGVRRSMFARFVDGIFWGDGVIFHYPFEIWHTYHSSDKNVSSFPRQKKKSNFFLLVTDARYPPNFPHKRGRFLFNRWVAKLRFLLGRILPTTK